MEYRSRASFLGLPLLHIASGEMVNGRYRRGVASGWVALGDVAMGLIACGGVAVGGLAIGGVSVGIISMAGLAIGGFAMGGAAIGFVALGGAAIGWYAALGGLAIAREYASGGLAIARHVLAPGPNPSHPFSSIPHPPVRGRDAAILFALAAAFLVFALSMRERRREDSRPC